MDTTARLFIRLTPGTLQAQWSPKYLNEFHGGPEALLRWLETQFGLPVAGFHHDLPPRTIPVLNLEYPTSQASRFLN
ncbi:MAG: hypothetical protein ACI814_001707 [Mariniblastus sp.]|jgi:hypothetical protein